MSSELIPQRVLTDSLADAINGRRVTAAVFTTFSFDPGFFELNILPALFDKAFSQIDKVRRVQLDELMRQVQCAVYYDRSALSQDALPAQLDFARIDVSRGRNKGVFHPKLILMLVEEALDRDDDDSPIHESLIVGTLSANLTRSGWWHSVEAGHFEEMWDIEVTDERYAYRKDLLQIIRQIRSTAADDEDHAALDRIHTFIRKRTNTDALSRHRAQGRHHTRLFVGQSDLASWLEDLNLGRGWNLEIISPFFDGHHATVVAALHDVLEPSEIRIFLPTKADGTALVADDYYDAVEEYAFWSVLPDSVLRPGTRAKDPNLAPRGVHAKIYRLWRADGKQVVLVGSVNLTSAAHSKASAGNLEAAFLVDVSDDGIPRRWWLKPIESAPSEFVSKPVDETAGTEGVCIDMSLRYDWARHAFEYRIEDDRSETFTIRACAGSPICTVDAASPDGWHACPEDAADTVRELLRSTSFVEVEHERGKWRVLVRETNMSHRPSLLAELTPEEILLYWSLLSPSQQERLIIEKLVLKGEIDLEGIKPTHRERYLSNNTVFDRFAGVYHAFEAVRIRALQSIVRREFHDAEARLFGAKFDSLPALLRKTLDASDDQVMRYIIFLSAKQLADNVRDSAPAFWASSKDMRGDLEELLTQIDDLEKAVELEDPDASSFLEWFREMFLKRIPQPVES